ncbi:hypothetical protein GYMLUDRAFT_560025 [Collybiopsis luxurians FD-317 M1]|uniref:MYND-type domain-containing protein n=1 Tax=Collybiopsis luxurians FD-317 M1 TaxID=944289 RepID=A0A0D0CRS2_9AGAR|nr:hypothetical protein GYMLUDRAFT_560025 [Collybiopsis luxurians FD-317 M1]
MAHILQYSPPGLSAEQMAVLLSATTAVPPPPPKHPASVPSKPQHRQLNQCSLCHISHSVSKPLRKCSACPIDKYCVCWNPPYWILCLTFVCIQSCKCQRKYWLFHKEKCERNMSNRALWVPGQHIAVEALRKFVAKH